MPDITDKDRGTLNRATGSGNEPRPYVTLVPGTQGGFQAVIVKPPKEISFEDEVPIIPSRKWHDQQTLEQAETVLARGSKGQHFKEDYLERLEQQLRKTADPKGQALASAVSDFRVSQARKDAARRITPANRGLAAPERGPEKPELRGPNIDPKRPSGEELPAVNLTSFLGEISKIRAQAEAQGIVNRFGQGQPVTAREARRALQNLIKSPPPNLWDWGIPLMDVQFEQIKNEIQAAEEADRRGLSTGEEYRQFLAGAALSGERQYQLLGVEDRGGDKLALNNLGDISRSHLQNAIDDVIKRGKRGEQFGEAYIDYLKVSQLAMERQEQLLGRSKRDFKEVYDQIIALDQTPHLTLDQEARDVLDRSTKGELFDDAYIDHLRYLLKDRGKTSVADALRAMQARQLQAEVVKVLFGAQEGKNFSELYIEYLKGRVEKFKEEDKGPGSQWSRLADALKNLAG